MKKTFILLITLLLSFNISHSQWMPQLGDSAFASLLTCGPGSDFYEVFGHTALRICDSANRIDIVFNYGAFDDFEHGFYLKFAKGRLDYCLMPQHFEEFLFEYMYFGRAVWEQRLNLSHDELHNLFHDLVVNAQPENMYYAYDFFRDNCATRVTDVVDRNMIEHHFPMPKQTPERITYRDLVHKYTDSVMLWWQMGIDILLGARCDRPITDRQYMFGPMEMMAQYDTILLTDGKPLAQPAEQLLYDNRAMNCGAPYFKCPRATAISPTLVFFLLLLAVAVVSVMGEQRGWKLLWLDGILFGLAGSISLLLLFLWLGSDHWCTKWNMNLLWANPLFVIMLFRLRKGNRRLIVATLACLALMLLIWIIGWPQHFSLPLMMIALTLGTRLFFRLKITK